MDILLCYQVQLAAIGTQSKSSMVIPYQSNQWVHNDLGNFMTLSFSNTLTG